MNFCMFVKKKLIACRNYYRRVENHKHKQKQNEDKTEKNPNKWYKVDDLNKYENN